MNLIEELESTKNRMIQGINAEFERLIERVEQENVQVLNRERDGAYESIYPLTTDPNIFKGTKPTGVIFGGNTRVDVRTWRQVAEVVMQDCIASRNNKAALQELCGRITGKKRTLLDSTPEGMRSALQLDENLYMETHYDVENLLNILTTRILDAVHYDYGRITVAIRSR